MCSHRSDEKSKFESEHVDVVKVISQDDSAEHEIKWANEYKAFDMDPLTHTIKLEADMLWTVNTDWWWYHLWQHDLVFSVDCRDYRDNVIKRNNLTGNFSLGTICPTSITV